MARAFAIEDGNLNTKGITVVRERTYKDIDLTFAKRPSGDIFKKTDAAAVKQAVKNILLTNRREKPFLPNYGGNLSSFLFSLDAEFDIDEIQEEIQRAISKYEPRAKVISAEADIRGEQHTVNVTVTFQILSTSEEFTVDLTITRLR